jgi:hypothetical protein
METPTFLYKPNFCAECGEKIERESWHFWTSRSFCENCEPVFRANRIVPVAFLGAGLFFTGIFFGQAGQRYQKPPPVTVTQSAAAAEKPQIAAPKQFAAANQPLSNANSASEPRGANTSPPANTGKPAGTESIKSSPIPEAVYICGARTQKGTPCSRRVKTPGRCWQHVGRASIQEKAKQED